MFKFNFIRIAALSVSFAFASVLLSSCELLDDLEEDENPKLKAAYVVTIHEIIKYPRGLQIELDIPTYAGGSKCVNNNYFIHSKNITSIVPIEIKDKPGFYDLDLHLDRRGRLLWTNLSMNFKGMNLAFVVDGVLYREFQPEMLSDDVDAVVRVKGPFDSATALAMGKNSENNYKIFNAK